MEQIEPIYSEKQLFMINEFYRLKQEYENLLYKQRQQKDNVSNKNIPKCINCKQPGGTLFSNKNKHLIAKCNAAKQCKLNIDIILPQTGRIDVTLIDTKKEIEEMNEMLVKIKLDLLFGMKSESETTKMVNELTEKLTEEIEIYNDIYELDKERNNNDLTIKRRHENSVKVNKTIYEIKQLIKNGQIREAIQHQNDILNDLLIDKHKLTYDYNNVEIGEDNPKLRILKQLKTTIYRQEAKNNDEIIINNFII